MPTTPSISKATILRITCLFWIIGKLICYKVWLGDRLFPLVPVWEPLSLLPAWVHMALYILSLSSMAAIMVLPSKRMLQSTLLAVEISSCLLDQNRWQPWEYQYVFTLFILLANKDTYQSLKAIAFLLAATYVYSGLNKFNLGFLSTVWDKVILHAFFKMPTALIHNRWVYHSGYILGVIELLSGVGLFYRQTRKPAAILLIAMHVFILILLGPVGANQNIVIWPWNMAMLCYLYVLFLRSSVPAFDRVTIFSKVNITVVVCWGILPALSFAGCWDNYLSANLYSGRQPYLMICLQDPQEIPALQHYMQADKKNVCSGKTLLSVTRWSLMEMKVPPYPEYRILHSIEKTFSQQHPNVHAEFITFAHSE